MEAIEVVSQRQSEFEPFSNGSGAGKNVACRTACAVSHPRKKDAERKKRCQLDCDSKYPPTEKQQTRREEKGKVTSNGSKADEPIDDTTDSGEDTTRSGESNDSATNNGSSSNKMLKYALIGAGVIAIGVVAFIMIRKFKNKGK